MDAGNKKARHAQLTGVQKAPRHEVAGSWAPIVRRALWGFNVGADVDDVGDVSLMPAGYLRAREIGRVREELRRSLGSDRGAIRTLTDAIGLSEIAAGAGPAYRKQIVASLTGRLAHEVSILFGVDRHFGSQPGAKLSMTIMCAPQHGHGQGSNRSASGAASGCCWGSAAGVGDIEEGAGGCDALGAIG